MVRWVIGSILHVVDPFSYFLFQPVLHDWCNKDRGMCYSVCGMVHIKEPLLLIGKSSPCGGSGFPLSRSEWSFTFIFTACSVTSGINVRILRGRSEVDSHHITTNSFFFFLHKVGFCAPLNKIKKYFIKSIKF